MRKVSTTWYIISIFNILLLWWASTLEKNDVRCFQQRHHRQQNTTTSKRANINHDSHFPAIRFHSWHPSKSEWAKYLFPWVSNFLINFFSKKHGYREQPLSKNVQNICTFRTPYGHVFYAPRRQPAASQWCGCFPNSTAKKVWPIF